MNLVDSCGWLEYFADSPYADVYAPAIEDTGTLLVCPHNLHPRGVQAGAGAAR